MFRDLLKKCDKDMLVFLEHEVELHKKTKQKERNYDDRKIREGGETV